MTSIAILTCWYGSYPWYFPYFIHSCNYNPTVDFYIITDNLETIPNKPNNVKIIFRTIEDVITAATKKLGFEVNIKTPYKLCDFKPTYGYIFSDILDKYDFWGHGDIDIIYGNIRSFLTEDVLSRYDIISTRHDYLSGSFLLYRNEHKINNLFKKSKDYKKVFLSEKHYCFDECNFKHIHLEKGISILDVDCEIESMEHVIRKEMEKFTIKVSYDLWVIDGMPGKLKWDNGLLAYDNRFEILLYHLIQYKSNILSIKDEAINIPKQFFIDKYTFRHNKSVINMIKFLYRNKYVPIKYYVIHYSDYFFSLLFQKTITNINSGRYKNILGETIIVIDKGGAKNINRLSYFDTLEKKQVIFSSKFNNNRFFTKGFSKAMFYAFNTKEGITKKIQQINLDGSISTFELNSHHKAK